MAFYDWNHDGKKDFQDDFLEYNIYKHSTGKNNTTSYSSGGSCSDFAAFVAVIIMFLVIGGLVNLFIPKCIVEDCGSERTEGTL